MKKITVKKLTKVDIKNLVPIPINDNSGYRFLRQRLTYGCDPELFLSKNGVVVGSETVIPKDGLTRYGKIIRDGIQVELNPKPSYCRQLICETIFSQIKTLQDIADKGGLSLDMRVTVPIEKTTMDSLSKDSKVFGCNSSFNVYGELLDIASIDGETHMKRSAGGHIHIGASDPKILEILKNPDRLVPILDLVVANTMVMIDRDEGNIERRKMYGRAGEYRTPIHGLEYRTLSNFWLNNYTLSSMAFGLVSQAIDIVYFSDSVGSKNDYATELINLVNIKDVRDAINNNDYDLALINFNKIKKYLVAISCSSVYEPSVISKVTIKGLTKLIKNPDKDYYVKDKKVKGNTLYDNWLNTYNNREAEGAERFLTRIGRVNSRIKNKENAE